MIAYCKAFKGSFKKDGRKMRFDLVHNRLGTQAQLLIWKFDK